jgi:hypothetical protein
MIRSFDFEIPAAGLIIVIYAVFHKLSWRNARFNENKISHTAGKSEHKSPVKTALTILALSASLALADDFKTNDGKEYKNATVRRVEPDGIVVSTKRGISKLYFPELSEDVRKQFHYDPQKAAAYTAQKGAAQTAAAQQADEFNKQRKERQQRQGEQAASQQNIQALVNAYRDLLAKEEGLLVGNRTNKECTGNCQTKIRQWLLRERFSLTDASETDLPLLEGRLQNVRDEKQRVRDELQRAQRQP